MPASDPASSVDLVVVGHVIKAHGLRGEVAVRLDSDVEDRLVPGMPVRVGGRDTVVATTRPHQGRPLIRFEHVHDRTGAEQLRGAVVEAAPMDPEDLDVYLVAELIDREVIGPDGAPLGIVSGLIEMPAVAGYDLLEVRRQDGTTWLLPAADELVEVEELAAGERRLRVLTLPEGLLEGGPS
jgi:16S rRNA processing protein RimM